MVHATQEQAGARGRTVEGASGRKGRRSTAEEPLGELFGQFEHIYEPKNRILSQRTRTLRHRPRVSPSDPPQPFGRLLSAIRRETARSKETEL